MAGLLLTCLDEGRKGFNSICRSYAGRLLELLRRDGHRVDLAELRLDGLHPSEEGYSFIMCFAHGRDREAVSHISCGRGNSDSTLACACLSSDNNSAALTVKEAVESKVFAGARVVGATCCWGARHFGRTLCGEAGAEFFVGYVDRYMYTDVKDMLGVGDSEDPFWLAVEFAARWLADHSCRPTSIRMAMMAVYAITSFVFDDPRFDFWTSNCIYTCLTRNAQCLRVLGGP